VEWVKHEMSLSFVWSESEEEIVGDKERQGATSNRVEPVDTEWGD